MTDYIRGGKYDGMALEDAFSAQSEEVARLTVERDTFEENAKYWHCVADGLRKTNEKLSADLAETRRLWQQE